MLDLQEIRVRLKDRKLTVVAAATGIHKATLYRLVNDEVQPAYETVKTLSDYLLERGFFARTKGLHDTEGT